MPFAYGLANQFQRWLKDDDVEPAAAKVVPWCARDEGLDDSLGSIHANVCFARPTRDFNKRARFFVRQRTEDGFLGLGLDCGACLEVMPPPF